MAKKRVLLGKTRLKYCTRRRSPAKSSKRFETSIVSFFIDGAKSTNLVEKWLFGQHKANSANNQEAITLKLNIRTACVDEDQYPQQDMIEECRN